MIEYATIVQATDSEGNPDLRVQGTQIIMPNGEKLPGVTKVTITGEADDVWRANVECFVRIDPRGIRVVPKLKATRLTAWQKLCAWLGGFYVDKTDLDSRAREYVSARRA